MTQHTKGEWFIGDDHLSGLSFSVKTDAVPSPKGGLANICIIMKTKTIGIDEVRANGHLICAAPDMQTELEKSIFAMKKALLALCYHVKDGESSAYLEDQIRDAERALCKSNDIPYFSDDQKSAMYWESNGSERHPSEAES